MTRHERRLHRVAGLLCGVACEDTEGLSRRLDAYATGLCAARRWVRLGHDSIALELLIRRVRRLRDMAERTAIRRIWRQRDSL